MSLTREFVKSVVHSCSKLPCMTFLWSIHTYVCNINIPFPFMECVRLLACMMHCCSLVISNLGYGVFRQNELNKLKHTKLMSCYRALIFFVQPLGYITLDWTGNSRRRAAGWRWRRANQTESLRAPFTDKNSTKKKRYFLEKEPRKPVTFAPHAILDVLLVLHYSSLF